MVGDRGWRRIIWRIARAERTAKTLKRVFSWRDLSRSAFGLIRRNRRTRSIERRIWRREWSNKADRGKDTFYNRPVWKLIYFRLKHYHHGSPLQLSGIQVRFGNFKQWGTLILGLDVVLQTNSKISIFAWLNIVNYGKFGRQIPSFDGEETRV